MPIIPRATTADTEGLYDYFETGKYPTASQFKDLIDSLMHKTEDPLNLGGNYSFIIKDDLKTDPGPGLRDIGGGILEGKMLLEIPVGVNTLTEFSFRISLNAAPVPTTKIWLRLEYICDVELETMVSSPDPETGLFKYELLSKQIASTEIIQNESIIFQITNGTPELSFNKIRFLRFSIRIDKGDYKVGFFSLAYQV